MCCQEANFEVLPIKTTMKQITCKIRPEENQHNMKQINSEDETPKGDMCNAINTKLCEAAQAVKT